MTEQETISVLRSSGAMENEVGALHFVAGLFRFETGKTWRLGSLRFVMFGFPHRVCLPDPFSPRALSQRAQSAHFPINGFGSNTGRGPANIPFRPRTKNQQSVPRKLWGGPLRDLPCARSFCALPKETNTTRSTDSNETSRKARRGD